MVSRSPYRVGDLVLSRPRVAEYAAYLKALPTPAAEPALPAPKPPPRGLVIGRHASGSDYVIPDSERFKTHVHVMGPSGWGKSFLLYSMICQDILAGRGVCLIDPHSDLYWMVVNFLIQRQIAPERVVLINPLADAWTLKFNPLETRGLVGSGADLAAAAMIRVFGATTFEETPRLGNQLTLLLQALEEAGEPLALLPYLTAVSARGNAFRSALLPRIHDEQLRAALAEFNELPPRQQMERIESTANRVVPFTRDPRVRRMMSCVENNLDWGAIMREGKIVLCNLGAIGGHELRPQSAQLLSVLIMYGILRAAMRQPHRDREPPFCVYGDEAGEYISEDLAKGLDGLRKRRVCLTLAHQTIAQVETVNPRVWASLNTNARIKLVFGGLSYEDAERMAKPLFAGAIDGNQVKYETAATAFRPIRTWEDIEGYSTGTAVMVGGAHTVGSSTGQVSATASASSDIYTLDGLFVPSGTGMTVTTSFQEALSHTDMEAYSDTWAETTTSQRSVTRVPVTDYEEFLQPPSRQYYTLEELWHGKNALLVDLPRQTVVVSYTGKEAAIVPTITVAVPRATPQAVAAYQTAVFAACPYVVPAEAATAELADRCAAYTLGSTPAAPPSRTPEKRPGQAPVTVNFLVPPPEDAS